MPDVPAGGMFRMAVTYMSATRKERAPGDVEQAKHSARVYLNEARNRRSSAFFWTLLSWAANARRRAVQPKSQASEPVAQLELFA